MQVQPHFGRDEVSAIEEPEALSQRATFLEPRPPRTPGRSERSHSQRPIISPSDSSMQNKSPVQA